jgi:hypothetical protein
VREYVNDNIPYPVGLVGCRCIKPGISFDCCEYDLAIFNQHANIIRTLILKDMILLQDDSKFILSSAISGVTPTNYQMKLTVFGRRAMINCLFHCDKIDNTIRTQPLLSSLWIKISAYDFLEGILALSGLKPMPIHELCQIRSLTIFRQEIADAVLAALECIGVKRATRYVVLRSFEGISQMNSNGHNEDLAYSKIEYLLNRGMMSDCYYYVCKIGRRILVNRSEEFCKKYLKPIQISMDLDSDLQRMENMYACITKACKIALKI